jgi:YHS domain-containing protein
MQVRTADAPAHSRWEGRDVWFCSDRCRERFAADPARYASAPTMVSSPAGHEHGSPTRFTEQVQSVSLGRRAAHATPEPATAIDPVCGMTVQTSLAPGHRTYADNEWFFCSTGCAEVFDADPTRYATLSSRRQPGPRRPRQGHVTNGGDERGRDEP